MRASVRLALALGMAVLVVGPALAQQRQRPQQQQRGQFGGRTAGGVTALLQNEGVQKELKLEQAQIDKVKTVAQQMQEKNQAATAKLRDLGQEERRQKQAELTRAANAEAYTALGDVLKPDQTKRLKQIELQQRGYQAFTDAEVRKVLGLTEAQTQSIAKLVREADAARGQLFQGGGFQQGGREKMEAMRKETTTKVQAVLNDTQKSAWKELTGAPFEVQTQRRRPDRG